MMQFAIRVAVPICNCQYQEHEWGYDADGIWIRCVLCKAALRHKVSSATITFDKPYPKGVKSAADKALEATRGFLRNMKG